MSSQPLADTKELEPQCNYLQSIKFELKLSSHFKAFGYKINRILGEGSYGVVYSASKRNGLNLFPKKYAIKSAKISDFEDDSQRSSMEMKLHMNMLHKNIIGLKQIITSNKTEYTTNTFPCLWFVMELCETDLYALLRNDGGANLSLSNRKSIMYQCLKGVNYMHSVVGYMHRDIKSANILLNRKGVVKIADFGLASPILGPLDPTKQSLDVVTSPYRPPEVFMGHIGYTELIDVWSLGCVFVELWLSQPLFYRIKESRMLNAIFLLFGTVNRYEWPLGYQLMQKIGVELKPRRSRIWTHLTRIIPDLAVCRMIMSMMQLNPDSRPACRQLLNNLVFKQKPKMQKYIFKK